MKSINYIRNNVIYYDDFTSTVDSKCDCYINSNNFYQINENTYINIDNVKEIDIVNNFIVFNNKDKISNISKKINI